MGYKLHAKKVHPEAKLPTLGHEGDLGYDLYALEDVFVRHGLVVSIRTGIAAQACYESDGVLGGRIKLGMLLRDRSSMAFRGLKTSGGVIDSDYTGEISVLMTQVSPYGETRIHAGDKIAQLVPIDVRTGQIEEVGELTHVSRGGAGFGSTGR